MGNTSILIRAQARGGKFLGPDINFSYVWVKNVATGHVLTEGPAGTAQNQNDSGNLCPDAAVTTCPDKLPVNGTSTGVVLTYETPTSDPTVRYLTADTNTAGFLATFDLAEPTLLEITVAGADRNNRGVATMWALPGMQLTNAPGFVVEVPGLAITLRDVYRVKDAVEVVAHVTMMCGCPIDSPQTAKNPAFIPWPLNEFTVNAQLWLDKEMKETVSMKLVATSQFTATIPLPEGIDPMKLTVWVTAFQASAANVGAAAFKLG